MTLKNIILSSFVFVITLTSCEGQNHKGKPKNPNKNDKSMNLTSSDTTKQIMEEDDFWKLIDKSRSISNNDYQTQIS